MKFEENWSRSFRGEFVQMCEGTTDGQRQTTTGAVASDHNILAEVS